MLLLSFSHLGRGNKKQDVVALWKKGAPGGGGGVVVSLTCINIILIWPGVGGGMATGHPCR